MKYLAPVLSLMILSTPAFADSPKEAAQAPANKIETKKIEAKEAIIRKVSPYSVEKTMDKFENILKKKGFDIFVRIDHQKNAEDAKLKMAPAQVIIFGNPKGGTMLMNQDIRVALDLPLRTVVYKDADEKVYIAYHDPATMLNHYDLAEHKVIAKITGGLDKLTSAAIAE